MWARRGALIVAASVVVGVVGGAVARADSSPPPGFQAAVAACAAQGLKQGTDAFAQCVNAQLGGSAPPAGAAAKLKAAQDACASKGLEQGTKDFASCVQTQLSAGQPPAGSGGQAPPTQTGAAPTATTPAQKASQQCLAQGLKHGTPALSACVQRLLLAPKQQAAYDTCVAQGKSGSALPDCVSALMAASSNPPLTARQQDDVDYCLGAGKVQGTPDFIACIKTAGNRKLTATQQAAVDQCQKQGGSDAKVAACVGALLTVKVPPRPGTAGPSPAAVEAAFGACIKQKLKAGSAAFQSCVRSKLSP